MFFAKPRLVKHLSRRKAQNECADQYMNNDCVDRMSIEEPTSLPKDSVSAKAVRMPSLPLDPAAAGSCPRHRG